MISLKMKDIKAFMNALLVGTVFDDFYLATAEIQTICTWNIDGRKNVEWYTDEEKETLSAGTFVKWRDMKPFVFANIKGNKTPRFMKIVFHSPFDHQDEIIRTSETAFLKEEVSGLLLQIKFEKGELNLLSGISVNTFRMDKALELAWDDACKQFLISNHIEFDIEQ